MAAKKAEVSAFVMAGCSVCHLVDMTAGKKVDMTAEKSVEKSVDEKECYSVAVMVAVMVALMVVSMVAWWDNLKVVE